MELPNVVNAPRELVLSGVVYRARALTLADLGEVLAWLEDHLPPDPEGGRDGPPLFSAATSRLALATTEGLAVVLHLALLPCQPAMSRDEARRLAAAMTAADETRLLAIALRRRPSYGSAEDGPPAKDLARIGWGEVFAALTQDRAWAYAGVSRLSLDQYDNHAARGDLPGPDTLDPKDVQRMWEEAMTRDEDAADQGNPEVLP